ncbi:MAG: hypothetical protein BSOLF_0774 [Candidatus Carbobacillus altaicus]|uniref:Uncharacterized protein n=1 Tax=Candidatus Carbonibacillus altaicus TaxID=2163959 RepID=A0A2R6XXB6_9BACL|nr:MAG: hypothetical protein BSOLF_0774 [Candidatus Carbobacillus altaicus]
MVSLPPIDAWHRVAHYSFLFVLIMRTQCLTFKDIIAAPYLSGKLF